MNSVRPTVPVPADPTVSRLCDLAGEILAIGTGGGPLAAKAAKEAVYNLRALALALDLPAADAVGRETLAPVVAEVPARARRSEPL